MRRLESEMKETLSDLTFPRWFLVISSDYRVYYISGIECDETRQRPRQPSGLLNLLPCKLLQTLISPSSILIHPTLTSSLNVWTLIIIIIIIVLLLLFWVTLGGIILDQPHRKTSYSYARQFSDAFLAVSASGRGGWRLKGLITSCVQEMESSSIG